MWAEPRPGKEAEISHQAIEFPITNHTLCSDAAGNGPNIRKLDNELIFFHSDGYYLMIN